MSSLRNLLQRYPIFTLILSVCCALFTMQRNVGFFIFLLAIPWLPWAIYVLVCAIRNPARRKFHLLRIGIWVLALTAAMSVHALYFYRARHHADEVVMKVKDWHSTHGAYPRGEDIGMERRPIRRTGQPIYAYREEEAFPVLFYADTFQIFASWHYSFEQDVWEFWAD